MDRCGRSRGRGCHGPAGEFLAAYHANQSGIVEATVENDPVANAVRSLAVDVARGMAIAPIGSPAGSWEGTFSELLEVLRKRLDEKTWTSRFFPQAANGLSGRLRRVTPSLRSVGVDVVTGRTGNARKRTVQLIAHADDAGDLSPYCS